jgi:hypothetical protein
MAVRAEDYERRGVSHLKGVEAVPYCGLSRGRRVLAFLARMVQGAFLG